MRKKIKKSLAFFLALVLMLGIFSSSGIFTSAEEPTGEEMQTEENLQKEGAVQTEENLQKEGAVQIEENIQTEEAEQTEDQTKMKSEDQTTEDLSEGANQSEEIQVEAERISVAIKDDIKNTGSLSADVTGVSSQEELTYQWYESVDGQNWTKIEDSATVDSKEKTYYVARDGARKYYKVQVSLGEQTAESEPFLVSYYDSLQNGSFENPVVSEQDDISIFGSSHFIQIPNGTKGLEWKTSARGPKWPEYSGDYGYYIEIADGSKKMYGKTKNDSSTVYKIAGAAEGNQFAELNCQTEGALYQDILTQPGAKLYWSLEHAGRDGVDTMAVIISDTKALPSNWNPSSSNYNSRPNDVKAVLADAAGEWSYHMGTYQVPEGQYVTRFYFVAVDAAGGRADGNLLDDIHFGKDVPSPSKQTGNLTITKSVEGIDSSKVSSGTFSFDVENASGEVVDTITLPTESGEWSDTLISLEPGTYTVTENAEEIEGYRLTGTNYQLDQQERTSGTSVNLEVRKKSTSQVSYTNSYEKEKRVLTVAKEVKGNMGDRNTTSFTFTLALKKDGSTYKEPVDSVKNGSEVTQVLNVDADGNYIFSLKNKEQISLSLPEGVEYTLSENALDYQVEIDGKKSEDGVAAGLLHTDRKIQYTNIKNISAPTGVRRMTIPYAVVVLSAVILTGMMLVVRKRRR